ncbi:hypothetical protein [Aurantiacibacter luteus]|uniref:PepSY domain-containing protein n=1 Tax=Aurantiacibacter luteus TaxID=1581420 RepID=A0A0G9MUC3_9SPHN|nr:hypothetical protein [Aurantiacibacter luteus]KLE34154.1 hypothetical protein AAW00_07700 [Aurantiacibacter luteus]
MLSIKTASALLASTGLVLMPIAAQADTASQLSDINGMNASSAQNALEQRGFSYVSNNTNSMGYVYSYWWDEGDDDCVQVEAYRGVIESISDASDQDCGHHTGGNAGAAVAAIAGAAILGAVLSHRSHHHDDNQHSADASAERDYEIGYTDGLHNAAYHNPGRSEAYSSGYTAGVDERSANLSHHSGRGGYVAAARLDDLNGARAAGGMEELERRGFRQVDNFTSGNARYSIQWNAQTRQCVQVTVADGHFYDVRDIGTNPNCR